MTIKTFLIKITTFCLMNQKEKICQLYRDDVTCFQKIPRRFEFDGSIDDSCSVLFPQNYSIYVEEFILDDPGPDNFVLLDNKLIEHSSKIKFQDSQQSSWKKLDKSHPLNNKTRRRSNYQCVKILKVRKCDDKDHSVKHHFALFLDSVKN